MRGATEQKSFCFWKLVKRWIAICNKFKKMILWIKAEIKLPLYNTVLRKFIYNRSLCCNRGHKNKDVFALGYLAQQEDDFKIVLSIRYKYRG